jgi:nucleotide-binding universal stress UspA family protein
MAIECPGYSQEFKPTEVFERILVPIDFSAESRRALITACETRKQFDSVIHVFVQTNFEPSSALRGLGIEFGKEDAVASARRCLDYLGQSICNGMHCLIENASFGDDVVKGVVDAASKTHATLVIMGLHQNHTLFRSRAEKIMRLLDIPVLLIQGEVGQPTPAQGAATTATT